MKCRNCDQKTYLVDGKFCCARCRSQGDVVSGQLLDFENGRDSPQCKVTSCEALCPPYEDYCTLHTPKDMINNPPHYNQFGVEVVDILEMYFPNNPHLWNAGKYLLRSGYKGHEIEDLKKLVWYVERYIKFKESNGGQIQSEQR